MTDGALYRAVMDMDFTGRTLEGLAMPWDTWATVREHTGGPAFDESHLRSSFDESLRRDPGPRNVWSTHEWAFTPNADPLGVVHFERGSEGLMFRAFLSKTRKADEQLELVKDGAKRAVSTGFVPLKSRNVQRPNGTGKVRVESKLLELSIVPTGRGQFPQARVLAMRSAVDAATFGDIQDAVCDAIGIKLFGKDGPPDGVYVYLPAIGDGWAVYCVEGGALDKPELNDNWRLEYVIGADGTVTLSDEPTRVEQQYVPVEPAVRSMPPAKDQLMRMRAGQPLLRPNIDPPR